MNKIWKGRISGNTNESVDEFTCSIDIDAKLYNQDIAGTAAYTIGLHNVGIINGQELKNILTGLVKIKKNIENGKIKTGKYEDIHSLVENELYHLVGEPALKIHTGRSRNDQIVLDERLFMKNAIVDMLEKMLNLQKAVVKLAQKEKGGVMPAYTHLQKAQPVLVSHYLLSYFDKFNRGIRRLIRNFNDCDYLPLGAAACTGSGYGLNLDLLKKLLKFSVLDSNSMDVVGSRDYMADFIYSCCMIMLDLSRFSEDLIIFNSQEFGFIDIDESYCTGSSIMPQKKNPDILELIRGKSSLVAGNLIQIITLLKALPSTYNRDLQEDKKIFFNALAETTSSIDMFSRILPNIRFVNTNMEKAAKSGYMEATEMADYLVSKGASFRNSHNIVGKIIKYCMENQAGLNSVPLDILKKYSPLFEKDVYESIKTESCIDSKKVGCGTASSEVEARIREAAGKISQIEKDVKSLAGRTTDLKEIIAIAGK
jgi:argininosuccinate lyase